VREARENLLKISSVVGGKETWCKDARQTIVEIREARSIAAGDQKKRRIVHSSGRNKREGCNTRMHGPGGKNRLWRGT